MVRAAVPDGSLAVLERMRNGKYLWYRNKQQRSTRYQVYYQVYDTAVPAPGIDGYEERFDVNTHIFICACDYLLPGTRYILCTSTRCWHSSTRYTSIPDTWYQVLDCRTSGVRLSPMSFVFKSTTNLIHEIIACEFQEVWLDCCPR